MSASNADRSQEPQDMSRSEIDTTGTDLLHALPIHVLDNVPYEAILRSPIKTPFRRPHHISLDPPNALYRALGIKSPFSET